MPTEPLAYGLLRSAEHSAWHMESRDSYTPDDSDWVDWKAGRFFDPAERWAGWSNLVRAAVRRGVAVHRIRIVSEPVSDYIRFEYDVTAAHNLAAGEQVRWLPRQEGASLLIPCSDFWLFDSQVVLWNHFAGNGSWVREEQSSDPALAKTCASSFGAAWERAIPHQVYRVT